MDVQRVVIQVTQELVNVAGPRCREGRFLVHSPCTLSGQHINVALQDYIAERESV